MNKVVLMGRLTKEPDIRQSQGAEPVTIARYTLAVDRRAKKQEGQQADFISCVAFGKAGEFAEKYLHKGTKICVSGRIQTGSYTRQDGTKAYTTDVVIEEQEFAESRNSDSTGRNTMDDQMAAMYAGTDGRQRSQGGQQAADRMGQQDGAGQQGSWEQSAMDGFLNIPDGIDEELPFN